MSRFALRLGRAGAAEAAPRRLRPLLLGGLALLLLAGAGLLLWTEQRETARRASLLAEAEKLAAQPADSPSALAGCQTVVRQLPEALAHYAADPQAQAELGRARRAQGQCLARLKRYPEAITELRAAIELRPEYAPLYGDLALAQSRNGQHLPAQRTARLAVQLDPMVWQAHRLHARVLDAASSPLPALRAYDEALRLAPPDQIRALEEEAGRLRQRHALPPSTAAAATGLPAAERSGSLP